jgi:hypothetical protein
VSRVSPPPAGTVALAAFRELPDGRGRQYTESWFAGDPWRGCEHFIRMCGAIGLLLDSGPGHAYALLDVIDEDGGILATYDIPDARAFRFIYRKLRLRVARTDGAQPRRLSCDRYRASRLTEPSPRSPRP